MKKALAVILSLFYIVAVSGVGMNLHYCCGNLDKVELSYSNDGVAGNMACNRQEAYTGRNCCREVHKELKITQPQNIASGPALPVVYSTAIALPSFLQVHLPSLYAIAEGSFSPHAPPCQEATLVYLKNCSFLI